MIDTPEQRRAALEEMQEHANEVEETEAALLNVLHERFAVYRPTPTAAPKLVLKDHGTGTVTAVDNEEATVKLIVGREFPFIPTNRAKLRLDNFLYREGQFMDIPAHAGFSSRNEIEWAWSRPLVGELEDGVTSIDEVEEPWRSSLLRMTDPEAFGAWVYGVASGRYKGRQILWVRGKGADGKSYMARSIADNLFHNGFVYIQGFSMSGEHARFTASRLENSRIVVLDDCKNPRLVSSELARTISGGKDGGMASIERKSENAYQKALDCRMMAMSNMYPTLSDTEADKSRMIFIEISSIDKLERDSTIGPQLKAALPSFLAWARHAYEQRNHKDTVILLNDRSERWIEDLSMDESKFISDFVNENFIRNKNAIMPISDLNSAIADKKRMFDIANIKHPASEVKNWLIENGWCESVRGGLKGVDVSYGRFLDKVDRNEPRNDARL